MVKLTIVLLLVAATCFAQHPLDTIRVQRLVVDTSSNLLAPFPRPARLVSLLEVRELHNSREGNPYWADCGGCTWPDYRKHLRYLTVLRAPIPFGWVVFEYLTLIDEDPVAKVQPHNWPLKIDSAAIIRSSGDTTWIALTTPMTVDSENMTISGTIRDSNWTRFLGSSPQLVISAADSTGYLDKLSWNEGLYMPGPHFIDFSDGDPSTPEDKFTWLPRRLRKRYLKYLKTHPHEQ